MKRTHSWGWAYRKVRGLHCGRFTAAYRATRYVLLGNTGRFWSHRGTRKSRIYR